VSNCFVNLRVHTNHSLSEGMLTANYIANFCKNDLQPACAITDTSNLFGVFEFSEKLSFQGIQPLIGIQINLIDDYLQKFNEIVLIAKNENGYLNLVNLSNKINLNINENTYRAITINDLKNYSEGLILLTGWN